MKEPSPTPTYSSCNVAMLQSAGSPDDIYWYAVSINRKLLAKKLATQRHSGTEHCSYATFTSHIRSEHISSDRRPYGYGLVTVRQQCYVLASLAQMGLASGGSIWSSAGCRYGAGAFGY